MAIGDLVGTLTVPADPNPKTFALASNPDGLFAISGNQIVTAVDPIPAGSHSATVIASDGASGTFSIQLAVAPAAFSLGFNFSGAENQYPAFVAMPEMQYARNQGSTICRIPLHWEGLQPTMNGPLDTTSTTIPLPNGGFGSYMAALAQVIANAASLGFTTVLLDVHNSFRAYGLLMGQTGFPVSACVSLWTQLSAWCMANPHHAILEYDLQNEPHDMDPAGGEATPYAKNLLLTCYNQVTAAIRDQGDTAWIHYEGLHYSGAWDFVSNNGDWMLQIVDTLNKNKKHVHCYLDSDSSGSNFAYDREAAKPGYAPGGLAVNANIGPERMASVTAWASANNQRLVLGECGWGNDIPSAGNPYALDNNAAWNLAGYNTAAFCQTNNIEMYYWGAGPGFSTDYGYNPEPSLLGSTGGNKDYTSIGFQATQMSVIRHFTGYAGAQPTSYKIELPFTSKAGVGVTTLRGTSGQPMGATGTDPDTTYFPFRVKYDGISDGTAVIVPVAYLADGVTSAGGTFTPASITIPAGTNPIVGFTYTPATAATILIGATNNKGWSNPPLLSITTKPGIYDTIPLASPIFSLRREYGAYPGSSFTLQRADAQQQTFAYNNNDDLPRQAMQDWAGSRLIKIVKHFDGSGLGRDATVGIDQYGGQRGFPYLQLQNAAGYPEIVWVDGAGLQFPFDVKGLTQQTIMVRANPTGIDQFVRQDYYSGGPFAFNLQDYFIGDPRNTPSQSPPGIGTGFNQTVSQSAILNAYHNYAGTFQANATNGQKIYRDGVLSSQHDTLGPYTELHTNGDYGNDVTTQLGWFLYYSPSKYNGAYQSVRFWSTVRSASEQLAIKAADDTYYSTPLPDTLSPLSPVAPTISGTVPSSVAVGGTTTPFSSVTIVDVNSGSPTDSITIALSGSAGGNLTGSGITGSGPYTIAAASAASVTTTLRALVFTPSGSAGSSETFAITVTSSAGTSATNSATVVSVISSSSTLVLDSNFAANTFYPGGTAASDLVDTRANIQYVADFSGALTAISPNTLAISSSGHLRNEAAVQNFVLQNGDMSVSPWSNIFGGAVATPNYAAAPDGSMTANRFTTPGSGAGITQNGASGLIVGNDYTYVFWMKSNTSSPQQMYVINYSADLDFGAIVVSADPKGWQPFFIPFRAGSTTPQVGFQSFNTAVDVLIWRPMVVPGLLIDRNLSPSMVPTTTASVTNPANSITIQHTGIASIRVFFENQAFQDITGINTAAQYTLPSNLNSNKIARIVGYSGALPSLVPYQAVGNRGSMAYNVTSDNGAPVEHVSYSKHQIGIACSDIKLVYTGRRDSGAGEVPDESCPCSVEASLYFPTAPGSTKQVRFTFDAVASSGTLHWNQLALFTDSLLPSQFGWTTEFPVNAVFYITTQRKMTAGPTYQFSINTRSSSNGDGGTAQGAPFTDYTLSQGSGVSGISNALYLPMAIIGRTTFSDISVIAFGDSLTESQANNNGGQGGYGDLGGWFARGMSGVGAGGVNGRIIPWSNMAASASNSYSLLCNFHGRSCLLPFFTHAINGHGHNSLASTSGTQEFLHAQILWKVASRGTSRIRHFEQVLQLPISYTSDGYLTYANQSVDTVVTNNSIDYDNLIVAGCPGSVGPNNFPNAYYDHKAVIGGVGTGNTRKWLISASAYLYVNSDQVHPASAGHDLMAPPFLTRAASWS